MDKLFKLRYTRSEKRAIALLITLISLVNLSFLIGKTQSKFPDSNNTGVELSTIPVIKKTDEPRLELNQADSLQLLELYGIGPAFSSRILKYRNLLGGYYKPEQLIEVYGMDSVRLVGFIAKVRVDTAFIRKINLRTVSFKDLLHHPYVSYEMVKSFVQYRDREGPPTTLQQVFSGAHWPDSVVTKLSPYLSVAN